MAALGKRDCSLHSLKNVVSQRKVSFTRHPCASYQRAAEQHHSQEKKSTRVPDSLRPGLREASWLVLASDLCFDVGDF